MLRRLIVFAALLVLVFPAPARAQDEVGPVEVIDISGFLDRRAVDFMVRTIERTDAQLVVLQIDSGGVLTGSVDELIDLVRDAPVPVAAWVGPAPARAYGGAAQVLAAAPIRAAAPGVEIGHLLPKVSGGPDVRDAPATGEQLLPEFDVAHANVVGRVEVSGPVPGLVDVVVPSIGQLVVGLHGEVVATSEGPRTLATARVVTDDDGNESLAPLARVEFTNGPFLDQVLRAVATPEATFFFLVAGLSLAAFEFYAAGVGVMGVVAIAALLFAGYGIGELPVRWWAVAAAVAGLVLYVADFQRNDLGWRSLLGTAALFAGGGWFVAADPHFAPSWWVVIMIVVGAALFFGVGMTAVVRSRFGTTTIGREHLVGRTGVAADRLAPAGVVVVDGAEWQAVGPRAGIAPGSEVEIVGVRGTVLEVALAARDGVRD